VAILLSGTQLLKTLSQVVNQTKRGPIPVDQALDKRVGVGGAHRHGNLAIDVTLYDTTAEHCVVDYLRALLEQ